MTDMKPSEKRAAAPASNPAAAGKHTRAGEALIRVCMIIVSIAWAVALYSHAGIAGWAAAVAAIVLYLGLAGLNGEWRNARVIAELNEEIARLEAVIIQRSGASAMAAASVAMGISPGGSAEVAPAPQAGAFGQQPQPPAQPQPASPRSQMPPLHGSNSPAGAPMQPDAGGVELSPLPAFAPRAPSQETVKPSPAASTAMRQAPPLADLATSAPAEWDEPAMPTAGVAANDWSFRPAAHRDDPFGAPTPALPGFGHEAALAPPAQRMQRAVQMQVPMPPPLPVASSIREADVAIIQGLIEKLAHEVSAAEAAGATPGVRRPPTRAADAEQEINDSTIASSLEALRVTADAMRRTAAPPVARSEPRLTMPPQQNAGGWASPVTANGNHARLAALAEAITSRRVDLLLEPILGLEDHRPRYYTVHVRPRTASGAALASGNLLQELRDTGLLPVLDQTRIARIAEVARRLADRGKSGSVFSEFSSESLGNDQFLTDFAKAYHERDGLSDQLVLSFAQSDVRALTPRDWSTIRDMCDLGFRFALQDVTDLDMDFARARDHGFDFITLDADVFLNGLPSPGGVVPVADLCRYLAGLGLTLIVSHINDEAKLARIFGFGALYGQGQLFGGPRLLKAEVARAAQAIAGAHGHAAA